MPLNPLPLAIAIALTTSVPDPQPGFQAALQARARGDLDRAESQLVKVCETSPGWALPWIELAEIQLARGAADRALASLAQAAVLEAVNPRVYHDRALAEQAVGRSDLAERDEAFAVKLRPEYAEATADLAELQWAAGKRDDALRLLQGLSAGHPDQVAYVVRLADAYSDLGQPVAAERELRLLIARDPRSPVWHRRLARLLATEGLNDQARREGDLASTLSHAAGEPRQLRRLPKSKH